jgi:hypothetical protein
MFLRGRYVQNEEGLEGGIGQQGKGRTENRKCYIWLNIY